MMRITLLNDNLKCSFVLRNPVLGTDRQYLDLRINYAFFLQKLTATLQAVSQIWELPRWMFQMADFLKTTCPLTK